MGVSWLGRLFFCAIFIDCGQRKAASIKHGTSPVYDATMAGTHLTVRATERVSTPREDSIAICLVCRDQHRDLREWATHHARLGVDKIYIFDDNSRVPLGSIDQDLVDSGLVKYEMVGALQEGQRAQLVVYNDCIQRYRMDHQWMAFIDADEFLIITDRSIASLPDLLREFRGYGGLAVNWQMYASSGHIRRPSNNTLASYTACLPADHSENTHVKTIANMDYVSPNSFENPHFCSYEDDKYAVTTRHERVDGPKSESVAVETLVLNHYVTKSLEDFHLKMRRGTAMGTRKTIEFFDFIHGQATRQCVHAQHLG